MKHFGSDEAQRKYIMTTGYVIASLSLVLVLPESKALNIATQQVIASLIFFLVLPLMYCKLILKEPLSALGLQAPRWLPVFFWSGAMLAMGGLLLLFLAPVEAFRSAVHVPAIAEKSFLWFIGYEVLVVGGVAFLYEVFFRGVIMRLWLRALGAGAIFVQSAIFIGFVGLSSGFSWQYAPLLYASFFSGAVAYFSRSIYASWLVNWLFFFSVDVFLLIVR